MKIEWLSTERIDEVIATQIAELYQRVWCVSKSRAQLGEELQTAARIADGYQIAAAYDFPPNELNDGRLVGCACGATRVIAYRRNDKNRAPAITAEKILALFGVTVDRNFRGRGIGSALVRRQFSRVDRGEYRLALWQTAIPEFYEKFGAIRIANRVINSLASPPSSQNPFWESAVMVYPQAAWSDTHVTLDLLGDGY